MNLQYEIGEQLIREDVFISQKIYAEIQFLKYIELGKLIVHPKMTPTIYTDLISVIKSEAFSSRYTNDTAVLFKDIENIQTLFQDPITITDDLLFSISPIFINAIEFINAQLTRSEASQRIIKQNTQISMTIDISCVPNLSSQMKKRIITEYEETFGIEIFLLNEPIAALQEKMLTFDTYYVANIDYFNDTMVQYLDSEKCLAKHIFCYRTLPLSKMPSSHPEQLTQAIAQIELLMTAAARFHFVKPFPCIA